jgi:hypothetical protein
MAPGTNGRGVQVEDTKICVVMVGLPARGKSYIAQKGIHYLLPVLCLNWPHRELVANVFDLA